MSHMKRLMDEHGICEAYIESQETALNTAKDKIQELEKLIEVLQAQSNYDEWGYLEDPESGIGIVINHFRDDGDIVTTKCNFAVRQRRCESRRWQEGYLHFRVVTPVNWVFEGEGLENSWWVYRASCASSHAG